MGTPPRCYMYYMATGAYHRSLPETAQSSKASSCSMNAACTSRVAWTTRNPAAAWLLQGDNQPTPYQLRERKCRRVWARASA